jgi:hypothetical protein
MFKQQPTPNISPAKTDSKRRDFLTRSLTGGIGLALVASQPALAGEDLKQAVCEAKLAPSDALAQFYSLLFNIQSENYHELIGELSEASRACTSLFNDLSRLVDALEKEVARAQKAQVQQLRDLTEIGRAHASLIRNPDGVQTSPALLTGLSLVSAQVGKTAQDLLPPGENTLSAEASRILNEIVRLVHESVPKQAHLKEVQQDVREKDELIRRETRRIEDVLRSARESAVVADNPLTSRGQVLAARGQAVSKITEALDSLQTLKTRINQSKEALESLDLLVLLLEGTRQWIKEPEKIAAFRPGSSQDLSGSAQADGSQQSNHARRAGMAASLDRILAHHCPPGSSWQVAGCATLLGVINGLNYFRRPSTEQRISAIERSLTRLSMISSCRASEEAHNLAVDIVNAGLA